MRHTDCTQMHAMSTSPESLRPFVLRVLIFIFLATLAVVGVWIVWFAVDVFLLIFAGILLGVFLFSLTELVGRWAPLGYGWRLTLVSIVLFGSLGGALVYMIPQIVSQVTQLTEELDTSIGGIRRQVQQLPWGERLLGQMPMVGRMFGEQGDWFGMVQQVFRTAFGAVANVVIVFFLGIYTAATPNLYRNGLLALVPKPRRARAAEVLSHARLTLWRWTLGRLFSMTVVGLATAIGLSLLGVPLPITLGVIAALLTFIPNIGPILAMIPPTLLAFQQGPMMALYVVLFFTALELVESYLLTPLVQQHEVSLPPALTISMQVLMAVLAGVIGLAMATPLAALILVLVQDLYVRDVLHDYETPLAHES